MVGAPQAQLLYSGVNYDPFTDAFGTAVSLTGGNDLKIRLGFSADYGNVWRDDRGETSRIHAYGITNLYYDLFPQDTTELAAVRLVSEQENLWGGLALGALTLGEMTNLLSTGRPQSTPAWSISTAVTLSPALRA